MDDTQAVSLYLDLEPGTKCNIEIVARAALAFSAAIKELTYVLDPGLEVRVELVSAPEGSLSLNSIIRAVKGYRPSRTTLATGALAVLMWFGRNLPHDIRTYGVGELIKGVTGIDETVHLSDEEKKQVAEMVAKVIEEDIAQNHVEGVYRALDRDPSINGVGATLTPGERPQNLVPRSEFPTKGGTVKTVDIEPDKRVVRGPQRLLLISPVLLPSATRKWKFLSAFGPISAQIKDLRFLDRLLSGQERIPMRANIEMDVILETAENRIDGVWVPQSRLILEVIHTHAKTQGDLFSSPTIESEQEEDQ